MIDATRFTIGMVAVVFLSSCEKAPVTRSKTVVRVIAISSLPEPKRIPYPHAAAVCTCRNQSGTEILVAIPAIQDRKPIAAFSKVHVGSEIALHLIPWEERPAAVRAMFIANDFKDLYDLPLYFGAPVDFP